MGKNQNGKRANRSAKKRATPNVFQKGPFRFTQVGSNVLFENLATPEQMDELHALYASKHDDVCARINAAVANSRGIIERCDPLQLLLRCYWKFLACRLDQSPKESQQTPEQLLSVNLLEYVQSLIGACEPPSDPQPVTDDDFKLLVRTAGELYDIFKVEYFLTSSADAKQKPNYDSELDEFRVFAEMHWLGVRGHRYLTQDIPHLREFLAPHSDALAKTYGVTSEQVIVGAEKLLRAYTRGVGDAFNELDAFRTETLDAIDEIADDPEVAGFTPPALMSHVCKMNGWEERQQSIFGRIFGADLFDVAAITQWPDRLVDALSIAAGSDQEFGSGPQAYWPTRFSESRLAPFVKLGQRSYYFNIHGLTDNLYRAVERALRRDDPKGCERWNKAQQNATETCALDLLGRLLPKASSYRTLHYQFRNASGALEWAECDGLLVYDRHLLVVEAKAGAYTSKPPGSYLDAHVNSIKKLIRGASAQANRFYQAICDQGTLDVFDSSHRKVFQLDRQNFDDVILCCVTLDQIEHIASHAEDLKEIGICLGPKPVWCVSIDDLRVYADIFDNPLIFLDFLSERMRAGESKACRVSDEMDHLGLYLAQNRYVMRAEKFGGTPFIGWQGFRDELDEYYSHVWEGESPKVPSQEMPLRLRQIIDLIAQSRRPFKFAAAQSLLVMDGETRDLIAKSVDDVMALQQKLGRPRPLSLFGGTPVTLFVSQTNGVQMRFDSAVEHTIAVLDLEKDAERTLLFLELTEHGLIQDVRWRVLRQSDAQLTDPDHLSQLQARIIKGREKLQNRATSDGGCQIRY
jgi:hypothetical protein